MDQIQREKAWQRTTVEVSVPADRTRPTLIEVLNDRQIGPSELVILKPLTFNTSEQVLRMEALIYEGGWLPRTLRVSEI